MASSSSPQTDLSAVRSPTTTPTPATASSPPPIKAHHHHHHHNHHHHHHRTHSVGQPAHRITRRKSMSANAPSIAAVAQVVSEAVHLSSISAAAKAAAAAAAAAGATATAGGVAGGAVAGATGPANKADPANPADLVLPPSGYPSPPSSLPTPGPLGAAEMASDSIHQLRNTSVCLAGSAIADGHAPEPIRGARSRRASEGAGLLGAGVLGPTAKIGRMRSGSELKCDKCGKGWEHTPEWSYTSKLLISKHQQVQLLEAASILVSMNPTPPDSASSGASNHEGNSSANDSSSSSCEETTPPPSGGSGSGGGCALTSPVPTPRGIRNGAGKPGKRYSLGSSYSRSYSSASTASLLAGSAPTTGPAFPSHLPQRPPPRPRAGSNVSGGGGGSGGARGSISPMSEDDALAAAVELLSCSFHTTPVLPPTTLSGSLPLGYSPDMGSPAAAGGRRIFLGPLNDLVEMKKEEGEDDDDDDQDDDDDDDDIRMEDFRGEMGGSTPLADEDEDEYERWNRRGRSEEEEEEDGVFGHMEE